MEEAQAASVNGRVELPSHVDLTTDDQRIGFTPRELDMIKERFGQPLTALIADTENGDDKLVALGWLKLRRAGYKVTWDDMRDIVIFMGPEPDPTNAPPPETSPLSVISGE